MLLRVLWVSPCVEILSPKHPFDHWAYNRFFSSLDAYTSFFSIEHLARQEKDDAKNPLSRSHGSCYFHLSGSASTCSPQGKV